MALRFEHGESITVGKEGIKLGGSFSLISDELGKPSFRICTRL